MANQKRTVRRPDDSGIVQQAVNVLIMAAVQDQEQEHQKTDHGSREDDESRYGDDDAGTSVVQRRYKM